MTSDDQPTSRRMTTEIIDPKAWIDTPPLCQIDKRQQNLGLGIGIDRKREGEREREREREVFRGLIFLSDQFVSHVKGNP